MAFLLVAVAGRHDGLAADLMVRLEGDEHVRQVLALRRFDEDGNLRQPVDPKAVIDRPATRRVASRESAGTYRFSDLPAGKYDLVILTTNQIRIEGFHYPPVAEFDPFLSPHDEAPPDVARWIVKDIAKSRHYENKVTPLYLAGDDKQVRILVQLLRDKPTSYDGHYGKPVATLRHEVWQYRNRYGGWVKDRKTKVLDRILMAKQDLAKWIWIWEPRLGGIDVKDQTVRVVYPIPREYRSSQVRGLLRNLVVSGAE